MLIPCVLYAQERRTLNGSVVYVSEHEEPRPAGNLTVTIRETGNSDETNSIGIFRIYLPDIYKAGEKITLSVEKPDWRIQYPLDGEARIPTNLKKELVKIRLLPAGSKLFWSHDRIEKLISDIAEKSREQVKPEGQPEDIDFGRYIKEWAVQNGFNAQEAKKEIDKWIAEVEEKENDFYKLGLAAFAKKNFGEAGKLFRNSAELKVEKLQKTRQRKQEIEERETLLSKEIVRDYRLEGDAHYSNYRFDEALEAYQKAKNYISREKTPRLWASIFIDIGQAHSGTGVRVKGDAIKSHLTTAVKSFKKSLEVYTRKELPQDWAATQNNLGLALQEQGIRTGGEQGRQLLAEAVAACKAALEVYTRKELPQDWAMTQNNLGLALQEQGIRTGGEQGRQLLAEAVAAYKAALEVRKFESLPLQWAQTQNNLAEAYYHIEYWQDSADCYRNVLKVYPDYKKAYQMAVYLLHEKLFKFYDAFVLCKEWLEKHPDDVSERAQFAENCFTTARFDDSSKQIKLLLSKHDLEPSVRIALRAINIGNMVAMNDPNLAKNLEMETLIAEVANQPEDFNVEWTFNGVKHFINEAEKLIDNRNWLLEFFKSFEEKNRNAIVDVLKQLQNDFKTN